MRLWIVIPARLDAQRLPRKPLRLIDGVPLIVHTLRSAQAAEVGEIFVACCGEEIAQEVQRYGGKAILTDPEIPSGTDRIWAALPHIQHSFKEDDYIVNVQGDIPRFSSSILKSLLDGLKKDPSIDVMTLVAPMRPEDIENSNRVKVAWSPYDQEDFGRALYFSRSPIPHGAPVFYEHIGIYAYRFSALKTFVSSSVSSLERLERLEQLRALERGLNIGVCRVPKAPVSIDTLEDLEYCQKNFNSLE